LYGPGSLKTSVLICGAISTGYTDVFKDPGPYNFMHICTKMLTVQGILLFFYRDQMQQGAMDLARLVKAGRLHVEENLFEGFEKAPALLPTMFSGKKPGKLLLKIADPS